MHNNYLAQLSPTAGDTDRQKRKDIIHQTKSAWLQKLSSLDHEDDDKGTVWNKKQEKETQIECPQDKLGELFKLACLMM